MFSVSFNKHYELLFYLFLPFKICHQILAKAFAQDIAVLNEAELQDWVCAFQTVAFDKGEEVCRLSSSYHTEEFEESNELYCSANEGNYNSISIDCPEGKLN